MENLKELMETYNAVEKIDIDNEKPNKIIREQFKKEQKFKIVVDFLKCFGVNKLINNDLFDQKEMEKRKKDILKKSFLFKNRDYCNMLFEWKKNKQIDTNKGWLGFVNSFIRNYGMKIYRKRNIYREKKEKY